MTIPKSKAHAKATAEEESTEQEFLAKQAKKEPKEADTTESKGQRISSTGEESDLSKEDFWRLKLIS